MQYLLLDGNETLTSLSRTFGQSIASNIIADNGIRRVPNIAAEWKNQCRAIVDNTSKEVSPDRKLTLLNSLTSTSDVFEKACLMDEDEWKVFSATQSFTDALRVPESISLPYSAKILGSSPIQPTSSKVGDDLQMPSRKTQQVMSQSADPVPSATYRAVANSLKTTGKINTDIFNTVNTRPAVATRGTTLNIKDNPMAFRLPWGKIQMYSTVLKELIDFPVYPEQLSKDRQATYTAMPDIIYQYEPWITFQNSGPREQSLEFHMHRDMWSGDHRDGKANKLIRFCEANTFADYNGSAVITPLVRFYIDGSLFISGVIKSTNTNWTGPIGLDNWYLEFTLSMVIQEISESALNCKSFYTRKLKEG